MTQPAEHPAAALAPLSPVAVVRALKDGELPPPGIARLLGFSLTRVQPGHVEADVVARDDMTNPMGSIHGGIAATMLDTVMGCAVQTRLDDGETFTTTDLQVHYVRSVYPGAELHAVGTVVHRGRRLATAEGKLLDGRGKLVAHATTSCMILGGPEDDDVRMPIAS